MVELGIGLILLILGAFAIGYCSNSHADDLARQRREADELTLKTLETVQALRAQAWQARHHMRRAAAESEIVEINNDNDVV